MPMFHLDGRRAGVQCILDEFLDSRGNIQDDLARADAMHRPGIDGPDGGVCYACQSFTEVAS